MKKFLLFTFFILLSTIDLTSAGTTGKINGKVSDKKTGEAFPFVNITFEGTSISKATDTDGKYIILNTSLSKYSVKFQYAGYQTIAVEKSLVTKDLTASTALVSSNEIQSLPVMKFTEVLEQQAGVAGGIVKGRRKGEVFYVIDSVPVIEGYDSHTVVKFFYFN